MTKFKMFFSDRIFSFSDFIKKVRINGVNEFDRIKDEYNDDDYCLTIAYENILSDVKERLSIDIDGEDFEIEIENFKTSQTTNCMIVSCDNEYMACQYYFYSSDGADFDHTFFVSVKRQEIVKIGYFNYRGVNLIEAEY